MIPNDLASALTMIKALQGVVMLMIAIIGFFVKYQITSVNTRLDRNENAMFDLSGKVQRIIGQIDGWNGSERRRR